ncbi:hypothetical protein ALC57_03762 [Trachymyrmex cornetzi]|uniref:Uncharacterized protein n=1 Tax=Trachymyrmex cornetzi TaxID=471704 RepID=A0A151JMI9_9HYME|nr:hypothetical protein ALC57_03762 [Trachymyrmex cornetzi]
MRERRYWEGEEGKKCRICESGVESWEHMWEECRSLWVGLEGGWQEVVDTMLGDEGEGKCWMREVEEERRKVQESVGVRVNEGMNEEEKEGERGRECMGIEREVLWGRDEKGHGNEESRGHEIGGVGGRGRSVCGGR